MPLPLDWSPVEALLPQGFITTLESQIPATALPPRPQWYRALEQVSPAQVKVVVLGQDPYPTPGHAEGLSFSVSPDTTPLPPSLRNLYKELLDDWGEAPLTGSLRGWSAQGVLLLNRVLTVNPGQAGSHRGLGWEVVTEAIIRYLSQTQPKAFWLWGKDAQQARRQIDSDKHFVHTSPHPSPLSAHRGFFGSKPFSKTNRWLQAQGLKPIDWSAS